MTTPPPDTTGRVLADRYRLADRIGEGGVGEVYRAEHVYLGKTVAVKLLRPHATVDPAAVQRLYVEARATSRIGHPNIVRIEDCGQADGHTPYLVMEWLEGETLDELCRRGSVEPMTALGIVAQVCEGLAAAHAAGVVHRDLKPANIFLTRDRRGAYVVKILDFGIAKLASGDASLTQTGTFVGTPYYISPEQALGQEVDARADIYSLGVILYELMTHTVPFVADTFMAIVHQHTAKDPEPPRQRAPDRYIPEAVEDIILRCMAKLPEERFASMSELRAALEAAGAAVGATASGRRKRTTQRGIAVPPPPTPTPRSQPRVPPPTVAPADADAPRAPRRRSRLLVAAPLAMIAAGVGIAMYAALGAAETDDAPPAPRATAPAAPAVPDAASERAGPDIPQSAWRYARGDLEVAMVPPIAKPGEPFRLLVRLDDAAGRDASVAFHYYRGHTEAFRTTARVPPSGWLELAPAVSRAGKYHVDVEVDGARRRFDVCIGADPADGPANCPRMNPVRGDG